MHETLDPNDPFSMCKSIADRWQRDLRYRQNIEELLQDQFGRPGTYEDALKMDETAKRQNDLLSHLGPKTIPGHVRDQQFTREQVRPMASMACKRQRSDQRQRPRTRKREKGNSKAKTNTKVRAKENGTKILGTTLLSGGAVQPHGLIIVKATTLVPAPG